MYAILTKIDNIMESCNLFLFLTLIILVTCIVIYICKPLLKKPDDVKEVEIKIFGFVIRIKK